MKRRWSGIKERGKGKEKFSVFCVHFSVKITPHPNPLPKERGDKIFEKPKTGIYS
jgi:hypothetical protein